MHGTQWRRPPECAQHDFIIEVCPPALGWREPNADHGATDLRICVVGGDACLEISYSADREVDCVFTTVGGGTLRAIIPPGGAYKLRPAAGPWGRFACRAQVFERAIPPLARPS